MPVTAPSEFWEMPLLRHVIIKDVQLPDVLSGKNDLILEDLHTLSRVSNLKCSEHMIKRIPNIKTLKLKYQIYCGETEYLNFGLDNFGRLKKLQSLNIFIDRTTILDGEVFQRYLVQNLSLSHSLKKLTLSGTMLNWDECTTKIGSLPLLQFLRLNWNACCGPVWETIEGQFCSLKVLRIEGCCDLRYWITDNTHFPRLENLVLRFLLQLEEIPSCIGDIPTLKSIRLHGCTRSAACFAKIIEKEQLELGNMDLQLHIIGDGGQNGTSSNDSLSYLKEIEDTFHYQREKYDKFIHVMKDFKALRIDTNGLVRAVKVLFKGHPNLILGISIFLPKGYKVTLDDDDDAEESPISHAISYLNLVKDTFQHHKEKYDGFLDVLNDYRAERIGIDDVVRTLKVLFNGHPRLIRGFNVFLPDGYEVTLTEKEEEALCDKDVSQC